MISSEENKVPDFGIKQIIKTTRKLKPFWHHFTGSNLDQLNNYSTLNAIKIAQNILKKCSQDIRGFEKALEEQILVFKTFCEISEYILNEVEEILSNEIAPSYDFTHDQWKNEKWRKENWGTIKGNIKYCGKVYFGDDYLFTSLDGTTRSWQMVWQVVCNWIHQKTRRLQTMNFMARTILEYLEDEEEDFLDFSLVDIPKHTLDSLFSLMDD